MRKPIKRIATIHDMCGIGKAALTNIMPVLATIGIEVCPIPTMILSTHTGGFKIPKIVKLDGYIEEALDHYKEINIDFDGIFIGYLGSTNNVEYSLKFIQSLRKENTLVVFDPIFGDNGKYYSNFDKSYSDSLKKLISSSDIITPNFTEACILSESEIVSDCSEKRLLEISRKLYDLGCENIVITSVPVKEKIGTAIYDGKNDSINIIVKNKLKNSYPGTGDIFTSVLIGKLLKGYSLMESAEISCEFVEECIKISSEYDYPTKEGVLLELALKKLDE